MELTRFIHCSPVLQTDAILSNSTRKRRRPCSDFMDMLRRLINCRVIIIIIIIIIISGLVTTANRRSDRGDPWRVCLKKP